MANLLQTIKEFSFNKEKHEYLLDGKPMTGVTSILAIISKPALISWAANEAVNYVKSKTEGLEAIGKQQLDILLEEARLAHRRKKEDAGEKGTNVHLEVEKLIQGSLEASGGILAADLKHESPQVQKFIDWAIENKVKFLASEKQVYCEKYFYAGTADFTCQIGKKRFVGDIKTSQKIYPEAFFQMAAYRNALEDMGEKKFDGSVVVNLTKSGDIAVEYSYFYQEDLETFLAALTIYRRLNNKVIS